MSTVGWVAIGVAGVVAYVACAGLAWRLSPVPRRDHEWGACRGASRLGWERETVWERRLCDSCETESARSTVAALWPVVAAWIVANKIVMWTLVTPLRATFRLCAGEIRRDS